MLPQDVTASFSREHEPTVRVKGKNQLIQEEKKQD